MISNWYNQKQNTVLVQIHGQPSEQLALKRYSATSIELKMSLVVRKPAFGVSDMVPHKLGCTASEDGWRLEISDLESRGIVLSM